MPLKNLQTLQKSYARKNERATRNLFSAIRVVPPLLGIVFFVRSFLQTGILFAGFSLLLFCCLLSFLPGFIANSQQKKIWQRFREDELGRIEQQCLTAPHMGPLLVTQDAVIYLSGSNAIALPIRDMVWVYPEETVWRKGLLRRVSYSLCIVLRDKTTFAVLKTGASGKEEVEDAMLFLSEQLKEQRPHALYGYSDERKKMFASEFERMVKLADGMQ